MTAQASEPVSGSVLPTGGGSESPIGNTCLPPTTRLPVPPSTEVAVTTPSCPSRGASHNDAVHLEHLGVLAVHVDAVRARDVPDVLRIRVAAVVLRRVLLERGDLALDVRLLQRDVPLVREVEVVPRDLVAEDRRALERTQPLLGDRLVILVDVVQRRLEDDLRLPVLPRRDEHLENVLTVL